MSIKQILFKNTAFNLTGYIYLLLVSFISVSLFLNNLGKELFGVYIFLASFVPVSAVFDFGVSLGSIKELSQSSTNDEKLPIWQTTLYIFLWQAIALGLIFSGLLIVLFAKLPLLNGFTSIDSARIIFALSSIIFINHLLNGFLSLPQSAHRFDVYNSKTFIVGTGNTLLSAILAIYTKNLFNIFFLQLLFQLISFAYITFYTYRFFGRDGLIPKRDTIIQKRLYTFGLKNFIGTLAGQIESQLSKFFLGTLSTASSITAFNIPQNIIMKAAGVVSQLSQAFFPLSSELLTRDRVQNLKKLFLWLQGLILLGGVIAVFTVMNFGGAFLTWWLNDAEVVQLALPILKILALYFVLLSLTPLPTALIQGLGKPHIPSFFAVLTTLLEAVFMIFLVPKYHELGAAYAFLITITITSPTFLVYSWLEFSKYLKKTLRPV